MRASRARSRAAARLAAVPTGPLGALSHDEVGVVFQALISPVAPLVAVALASTCHGLRVPVKAVLAELRRRHEAVKALLRKEKNHTSCAEVGEATELRWYKMGLTAADCRALADVIKSNGLPRLEDLNAAATPWAPRACRCWRRALGAARSPH